MPVTRVLVADDDAEIRAMIQGYLDMKRRHLQKLQELTENKAPAAA